MNRLKNLGCYLSGPIDFAENLGSEWRDELTPFLQNRNVKVFDPLKPMFYGAAHLTEYKRPVILQMAKARKFEELRTEIKELNKWDLRAVDLSSFVIVNYRIDIHMCGTYEEIFEANKQNKPVLLVVDDMTVLPKWIYGRFPHEHMFEGFEKLKEYLINIDENEDYKFTLADKKRWLFFDGPWMYREVVT